MRKISLSAAKAMMEGKPFKRGNTAVTNHGNGVMELRLYSSVIATWDGETLLVSLCGYNTATTRERLNTLLQVFGVFGEFHVKNSELYFNCKPIGDRDYFAIKPSKKQG